MYKIGFLTSEETTNGTHTNCLKKKGWEVTLIKKANPIEGETQFDAILIHEDDMATTCGWLIELTQKIKVPIYLLSKEDDSHANVVYLQLGGEICFSSKIDPEEFLITLNNLLARVTVNKQQVKVGNHLKKDNSGLDSDFVLVPNNLAVIIDGEEEISLTRKEFQAMEILYNNPGRAISYEEFKETLWESETDIEDKNYRIANTVFHLRSKIEQNTTKPRFIKTVRSKGYMFKVR
ncbi:winged helix-turn-helix domain-containing protein [Enterococcus quebecensis]|uniref:OmpR/PhoB-type domain-containing protein n=1 Tax=Enterococcus quebecensis TaxID=903983 RepID=A0A1E5GW15_9ENTE|nr:winged helix-turn-helix domain-containing protein [Enterococcus quebecensis]OEG16500.1 hypothetical protein BCR23_06320 [Enterococcus quebecensis]OJG74126.1 hypothetical protein RV12_GL002764 [Enterococcus quebecensis]